MSELETKSLEFAVQMMETYGALIGGADPRGLRLILQKCYMEGYGEGLRVTHESDLKAIKAVLGGEK